MGETTRRLSRAFNKRIIFYRTSEPIAEAGGLREDSEATWVADAEPKTRPRKNTPRRSRALPGSSTTAPTTESLTPQVMEVDLDPNDPWLLMHPTEPHQVLPPIR